jgi:hypothetical protein
MFLGKYVRKTHSDSEIKQELKSNEGMSFLDLITPSDIAFVICIVKNARHVWDQTIRKIGLGEQVGDIGENEAKVQPLFTKGVGKKKEQGRSLWSDEGMKYYRHTETVWRKVYKDELIMKDLYRGFDKWLNTYGREIIVSKTSSKSLHSVLARWIAKEDENNNNGLEGTEEVGSINGSDDDEEEGYFSDKGNNTLSIIFAKEDRARMRRSGVDDSDSNPDDRVDLTNEMRKRRDGSRDERDGDDVNNNSKRRRNKASRLEGREESKGSDDEDSTVGRGRRVNRENGVDSPAKNTRGHSSKRN